MDILLAIAIMALGAVVLGAALGYASIKFKVEGDPLVDKIEAILPQTQCGQCGYPGCKPYAEAIANGDEINKCPPGGSEGVQRLALAGRVLAAVVAVRRVGDAQPAGMDLLDIKDLALDHSRENQRGAFTLSFASNADRLTAASLLKASGIGIGVVDTD